MDKNFISIDKQRLYFKIFNIVCVGLLCSVSILALFSKMLPKWFVDVSFYVWFAFLLFYLICDLILYLKIKRNIKQSLKSKYLFDRNKEVQEVETKFKDCILQEVEFYNDGFILHGLKTPYKDVKLEYSIYGDNIMFHIYMKGEEINPLLVFIVTEKMYYMIKKFDLNLEMLNKEIDMLNLNN